MFGALFFCRFAVYDTKCYMNEVMFYIAHASLVMICLLLGIVIRYKSKSKLGKHFIAFLVELLVWTLSVIAVEYSVRAGNNGLITAFENLAYIGVAFIAVTILHIGIAFNDFFKGNRVLPFLLYVMPVITQIVIWTNPIHHTFYISYDPGNMDATEMAWYFWIHSVYSYICLLVGMALIVRFAFNSRGNSRWQAIVVSAGSVIPLVVNVCYTLGVKAFSVFSTPIAFMITIITYFIGIFKFNLLRATPIALRTVIDRISDLYIVIDENMRVLDYNEPFARVFGEYIKVKKNMDVRRSIEESVGLGLTEENFIAVIARCRDCGTVLSREFKLLSKGAVKYYTAEATPLNIDGVYCGCILLLRDITQAKIDMEEIKRSQTMLIERERLASLGQLMGGIAHNLKTPILAASGRAESLLSLIDECVESMGNDTVTKEDHAEIAKEMRREVNKIKSHMSYISDIISTVKDQTVKFSAEQKGFFTTGEMLKRVEILMQHELLSKKCELKIENSLDGDLSVTGDIISLIQVLDNIIINSIQAYGDTGGVIKLCLWHTQNELFISVSDRAGGIKKEIRDKLFRQMITTKGIDGTGLGLYISYATVAGMFGGKMTFKSVEDEGTEFLIALPLGENTRTAEEE